MKTKILFLVVFSLTLFSCSNEEVAGNGEETITTSLPIASGNFWNYKVYTAATTDTPESWDNDKLYVENDFLINGISYKKMKTLETPFGFYSGTLNNNGLRIDGNKIKLTGAVSFDAGLPTALNFDVLDFIVLKEGAPSGEELSTTSGSFVETVDGYPLTFEYSLKSITDGTLNSLTSDGDLYTEITKTKIILNLKIYTIQTIPGVPTPISIPIMNAQDVLISTQYYSKNIGLVYNKTDLNYTLNQIPAGFNITISFPSSGSQTQEEFLDTYLIN